MNIESYNEAQGHYIRGTRMKKSWLPERAAEFKQAMVAVERDEDNLNSQPDLYFGTLKALSETWDLLFQAFGSEEEKQEADYYGEKLAREVANAMLN
jgi:hypothetical protein